MTKEERKRQIAKRVAAVGGGIAAVTVIAAAIFWFRGGSSMPVARRNYGEYDIGNPTRQVERPELDVQLLTVNEYSRPGTPADRYGAWLSTIRQIRAVRRRITGIISKI